MYDWISVPQLVADLKLTADPLDHEAVRAEVRRELVSIHPDRNGGSFRNEVEQERYHRLVAASDFLGRPASTALVPIQEIPALVSAVRAAISREEHPRELRTEYREMARSDTHQHLVLPRVGSGAFAAISAGILAFSGQLADNPVFAPILKSEMATPVLLMAFFYSGLFFVMTWIVEQRAAARADWLATDEGRRAIIGAVLRRVHAEPTGGVIRFRFSDVVRVIRGDKSTHRSLLFAFRPRIAGSAAEKLADFHLQELVRRQVVRKVDERALDLSYEIDLGIAEELMTHAPRLGRA